MNMIGNVSYQISYAVGALIKVADSAGSTVFVSMIASMIPKEYIPSTSTSKGSKGEMCSKHNHLTITFVQQNGPSKCHV